MTRTFKAINQMRLYNVHNYPKWKIYLGHGLKASQSIQNGLT